RMPASLTGTLFGIWSVGTAPGHVRSQIVADGRGLAVAGVDDGGAVAKVGDGVSQCLQVGDPSVQIAQAGLEQVLHVLAGRDSGVADVEHLTDLGESEPSGAAAANEVQPRQGLRGVVAVTVGGALGRG